MRRLLKVLALIPAAMSARPAVAGDWDDFWVDAGGPYAVYAGDELIMTATGSMLDLCVRAEFAWDLSGDGLVDTAPIEDASVVFPTSGYDGPTEVGVHVYVTCWLIDELASVEGTDGSTVTVRNARPEIQAVSGPTDAQEGDAVTLTVDFDDPEEGDTHTISWRFGDGQSASGLMVEHSWAQDGTYALEVVVTDDDGDRDSWLEDVRVGNVAPSISGSPEGWAVPGQTWTFEPSVFDPGVEDLHSWSGSLPPAAVLDDRTGRITWTPTDADLGEHPCSLSVEDDAGDGDTVLWSIDVRYDEPEDSGSTGSRPIGDGNADADPWSDRYGVQGEGCRCATGAPAAAGLWAVGLLALVGRRRRDC